MDIEIEVDLDDKLVADLMESTGITDINELVRRALKELIQAAERGCRPTS